MAKITNRQHEQQQDRGLAKLEKRVDADVKIVANHKQGITDLVKLV